MSSPCIASTQLRRTPDATFLTSPLAPLKLNNCSKYNTCATGDRLCWWILSHARQLLQQVLSFVGEGHGNVAAGDVTVALVVGRADGRKCWPGAAACPVRALTVLCLHPVKLET